uniref:Glypican 6b n=1 Tax=Heterorhabditis bacteriophora TaxID=37862 RepID=A0A1I7XF69_HETBA
MVSRAFSGMGPVLALFSNKIMLQSTPVEAPRLGWGTMAWTLCTCHRAPRTRIRWRIFKQFFLSRIYAGNRRFETVEDLQSSTSKVWSEVEGNFIKNLVDSMSERIFQVTNGSSNYTDYYLIVVYIGCYCFSCIGTEQEKCSPDGQLCEPAVANGTTTPKSTVPGLL